MKEQLQKRLARTNTLFLDALAAFGGEHLGERLGTLPSNTVGAQYWCVVGARHSYLKGSDGWSVAGILVPVECGGRDRSG